jgi:signal transduction histidine kinase
LRRDLHDGLGPTLASITLKLDTIRNLIQEEPEKADQLLAEAKGQVQETIKDIRRLVYDLRPPALDELGFIPAVSQFIEQQRSPGLKVTLEAPDSMPQLPAAVEVAGYRIVQEGLTNVLRHAQASEARVVFEHQNSHLSITISDNGVGLPEGYTTGIGLNSMRERVNELGGIFKIHSSGKGAEIRATIPWAQE